MINLKYETLLLIHVNQRIWDQGQAIFHVLAVGRIVIFRLVYFGDFH